MAKFYDRLPVDADSLIRRIEQLETTVRELRAARRLEAASIGEGGITIQGGAIVLKDADGNEIARMGVRTDLPQDPSGHDQPGFILRRNDGTIVLTVDDPDPVLGGYKQFLKIQDAIGNVILAEDATSGFGLAAPHLATALYPAQFDYWPKTSNAAFETLYTGRIGAWNPRMLFLIWGTTDVSGATGELRLLANGVSQGTRPVSFAVTTQSWTVDMEAQSSGLAGTEVDFDLQARRTSATATHKTYAAPFQIVGHNA